MCGGSYLLQTNRHIAQHSQQQLESFDEAQATRAERWKRSEDKVKRRSRLIKNLSDEVLLAAALCKVILPGHSIQYIQRRYSSGTFDVTL